MEDVSNSLLVQTEHFGGFLGAGVSFVDFNGDYLDDLSFADYGGILRFYAGTGDEDGFVEVEMDLPYYPHEAKMILWGDIDNDGDRDLFVSYRLAPNRLYINNGQSGFEDVSATCGLDQSPTKSYGACWGDYNADGLLDLFIANYTSPTEMEPFNELYRNIGEGQFAEVTFDSDMGLATEQSFQGQWVDFNEDSYLDMHVVRDRTVFPNFYLENQGPNSIMHFVESSVDYRLDVAINCMSSSIADFDHDFDQDIYLTAFALDSNWLMVNDGGVFDVINPLTSTMPMDSLQVDDISWAANWLDVDNNGWEDLHVSTCYSIYTDYPAILEIFPDKPDWFFLNDGGIFTRSIDAIPTSNVLSFATATGDYNLDGFPDLVSHRVGEYAQVLKAIPNENHWLRILTQGIISNFDGVGAKIFLWAGDDTQYHMRFSGENYLGQNSAWEHFGLGDTQNVDSLVVVWPSGQVNKLYDVSADQHLLLYENGDFESLWPEDPCDGPENPCVGCMYSEACNYNEMAETDDGTCDFTCLSGDSLCGLGTVWSEELGQCVVESTSGDCASDINGDGFVSVADLLILLTDFDAFCEE